MENINFVKSTIANIPNANKNISLITRPINNTMIANKIYYLILQIFNIILHNI